MKAESMIPCSWFYRNNSEKTMFNWFLYELSLKIYDHLQESKLKPLNRWKSKRDGKQIAEFCAYYAKRMRVSILENLGGSGIIALYDIYITDYCHSNAKSEDVALGKVIAGAWRELLESCSVCPCMCLVNMDKYCEFFDRTGSGGCQP